MAISFEDSLKEVQQNQNLNNGIALMSVAAEIPAYDGVTLGEEETWELDSSKYQYYAEYSDDKMSIVDEHKNVTVHPEQINLTQETNSQYIPFEMPRYYDGFDLSTTEIYIHFVNRENRDDFAKPINVYYGTDKIRFAWLVDKRATAIDGNLKFEIEAIGTTSKGDEYNWKTMPNSNFYIMESLCGNGKIEVNDSWSGSILTQVLAQVEEARAAAREANQIADSMQTYVDETKEAVEQAEAAVEAAENATTNAAENVRAEIHTIVEEEVANSLLNYYTKNEVDVLIQNIDISDQLQDIQNQIDNLDGLANFNVEYDGTTMTFYNGEEVIKEIQINSDPSAEWTAAYTTGVEEKISTAKQEVQTELNDYKTITDEDLKSLHDAIDGLPETLASDYYTKTESDDKFATKESLGTTNTNLSSLESSITTNKTNISTLSTKVSELETTINGIDQSPRLAYEATYDEEQTYTLWEIEGEGDSEVRTAKSQFKIQGGGGSSTSSVLKIEYVTKTPLVVTTNDKAVIVYNFSGTDSSGDAVLEGIATWKVSNTIIATHSIASGENTFDVTDYINVGTQKVTLSVVDDAGSLVTKSWTVQKIDVRIESSFNDDLTYPMGEISFDYTPYGAVSKDVHFILDGEEIGSVNTSASGIPQAYTLPAQEHGAHLLEVYMTTKINNNDIESNHIVKDIIWYDATSQSPVISCTQQDFTARQYDTTNIEIVVYDPSTETPTITLAEDGVDISTITMSGNIHVWQYRSSDIGDHVLTVTCGDVVKTLKVKIEELDIKLEPVTAGLVFDFNPTGKTNGSDREWSDGDISMTVSDNFDWVNGGYQMDENGDQYFCIKAGTSATINYQLFADDAKKNGKEFKLVFKTTNVQSSDALFLTCKDNTTGSDHIGIDMGVHEAHVYAQAGNLELPYSEEDIIEFEFNISKDTEAIAMVSGYEDGVSTRHMVYDSSHNFTQTNPKYIEIGSDKCDLHIYRFKVYNSSLSARGILSNFIADARNADDMIDRYNRNQIYDENSQLDPDVLAEKCPWLRVYKVSAPYFTNNKSDKVPNTTIQQIYKNGDVLLDNWTAYNAMHSGQGTSSNNYGAAGRNLDFIMNNSGIEDVDPYFILGDGKTRATEITMTRTSVPVAYLNAKVNIASANNMTNAMLANRYNKFNPYKRKFIRDEGVDTSFIKDTMEFHNCVIFIQETNPDVSTHREFADTNWHFYAIGNIGDSKKTDKTRLTDKNDPYECCIELMDVELPLSDFPADTMMNAMGYTVDKDTQEKIYTWAKDSNLRILHELIDGEYVLTSDTTVDLNKTYYVDILEHDDFSEDYTYGWRYISDDENEEIVNYCHQKWIEFYRFLTTSTDEEFKANFGNYFVVDSALYYYLFTERYCMVDNRAKNLFFHYGKTGEVDSDGNPIRKWDLTWDYDNDTSLGLNNYGLMSYRYGLEDTDVDEKGEEVFRESDSTFFRRLKLFGNEMKIMFNTLESQNAWHAESFINDADAWQSEFPEELWRIDIDRKYIRTYNSSFINGEGDSQFLVNMANGRMKYQRRQWERNQEKYMASKYQSSVASSDNIVLRCTVPEGDLVVPTNYKLKLTPYAHMYLNVKYGTTNPIQVKAVPNVEVEIPFTGTSADIVDVYSASLIKSVGDLSSCYPATVDTSKASKLKDLVIGNETVGYDNPSLTTLTLGANYLLETLNIENVSGLTQSLDMSLLNNLKELYAHGSSIGGVTFADGGNIEIAELPDVNAITMKNLIYLTTLDITSFNNLTKLIVEECDTVDLVTILNAAQNVNRVRIMGVEWTLDNTDLLKRIYKMYGVDSAGYNTTQSVLTGKVHVAVIRQQELREYQTVWPDLEITFDSMIEQFPVTFLNDDGTVLEVQYVDKGADAVDPVTREINPIPIPTKESTVSTNFTFMGWDSVLTGIFAERTIVATYSESLREYTIRYVSKGTILQESTGLYGDNIIYNGSVPTYTLEESAYKYYLFNRWDQSGFIDGEKTVNAVFDSFEYTPTALEGKELSEMTPVEIYAITKLGLDTAVTDIQEGDKYSINLGYDYDYDDIESELIVSEKQYFNGTNYLDTGIQLFDVDKDFVLAIDYEFLSNNSTNAVLAQCFQSNGTNGFKLWYNNGVKFTWGTSSTDPASINSREMIVIRHKKGEYGLTIYNSNMSGSLTTVNLTKTRETIANSTLVFGCMKADDGAYENYAIGNINWSKVWYKDLGDEACRNLVGWIHETVDMEVCGFKKYYLTENPSKRCTFTLLASNLLDHTYMWNSNGTNAGGWKSATLNAHLNNRLYNSLMPQMKALIKQVSVQSSIGSQSTEISSSDCYITIPAIIELCNESSVNIDPYIYEGSTISYMISESVRKRAFKDGDYASYWTRSPNISYSSSYIYQIDANGKAYGFGTPKTASGVLIEISI